MAKNGITRSSYTAISTNGEAVEGLSLPAHSKPSAWSQWRMFFIPMICTVASFWLGLIAGAVMFATKVPSPSSSIRSFVPDAPLVSRSWDQDFRYANSSRASDHFWEELMPLGNGRVRIESQDQRDLPSGEPIVGDSTGAGIYVVSVAHQIHCLALLRNALINYGDNIEPSEAEAEHLYHCIDYLRHGVVCASDTTIEWPKRIIEGNETVFLIDGQGSQHQCRDWDVVKEYVEAHRVDDARSAISP